MSYLPRLVQCILISAVLVGSGSVLAQSDDPPPAQPAAKGSRATLPDSVRRVERQTGGEVLRAEPMQRDGREVYRLKVLTSDGRVRVMQEDPSDPPARDSRPGRSRDKDKHKQSTDPRSDEDPPL